MPQLSKRLKLIASLVPNGARVCDIGTDHGYLAIELKKSGKAASVIAADINSAPLENAKKNIEKSGVSGIVLRLCDGLSGIAPEETDTVIIAGMGGEVIAGILERGSSVVNNCDKTVILQPTTSPEILRKFLYDNGLQIRKEIAVLENGKIYSVMLVKFTGNIQKCDEYFYYTGKVDKNTEFGRLYIEKQLNRCLKCARPLEFVPGKTQEYLYYKNIVSGIENHLKTTASEN